MKNHNYVSSLETKNLLSLQKKTTKAFTLVELIVVIVILAILGTISFIAMQGYSKNARDSVRMSDLSSIDKAIGISLAKNGTVPIPDEMVEITASGILTNYQGVAGERALDTLGVFNGGKDPTDQTYYSYATNSSRTRYQLLGFLEEEISYLGNTTYAKDLSNRTVEIKGNEVGILLNPTTSEPITTAVDVYTTTQTYKAQFSEDIIIEGTGGTLFTHFYNRNTKLLRDKSFAKLDDDLLLYMDMETTTSSGANIVLEDLSQYGHNGTCYNSGAVVNCLGNTVGPQIIEDRLGNGKVMVFDGVDDVIGLGTSSYTLHPDNLSIYIRFSNSRDSVLLNQMTLLAKHRSNGYGVFLLSTGGLYQGKFSYYTTTEVRGSYLNKDEYYDLIGIFGDGESKIYYKGFFEKADSVGSKAYDPLAEVHIGAIRKNAGDQNFQGKIDEVRIYSRALSEEEIRILNTSFKKK